MTILSGWGRTPTVRGRERRGEDLATLCREAPLTRGLGRSYGDASLPAREGAWVASSRRADCLLAFDGRRGLLRAEAGLSLGALQALVVPRGWTCPVIPGTAAVTLGGMVAADVHGKNHHGAGTLGRHLHQLRLLLANGQVLTIGPDREQRLFAGTVGGMGLTGHILEVELQLAPIPSPWILAAEQPASDLESLLDILRSAGERWPFTVAWVDSLARGAALGRGLVIQGRWAREDEVRDHSAKAPRAVQLPCDLLSGTVRRPTVAAYNALHYHAHRLRPRSGLTHPQRFFHPLDAIRRWNRLHGSRGFVQHQCVLPGEDAAAAVRELLQTVIRLGGNSFLTVIKDCGAEGQGLLSFPRPGLSVAMDLPFREASRQKRSSLSGPGSTQALIDALNEVVIAAGGRIYLAKDALTRPEHFAAMEPRLADFLALRRSWDPTGRLKSALSVRLFGDSP